MKGNDMLWTFSLIVAGGVSLLLLKGQQAGAALPGFAVRVLGAAGLAALGVLAFTTVRKLGKS